MRVSNNRVQVTLVGQLSKLDQSKASGRPETRRSPVVTCAAQRASFAAARTQPGLREPQKPRAMLGPRSRGPVAAGHTFERDVNAVTYGVSLGFDYRRS
eukprot:scaffold4743_cov171-Amphora_coffeaeformis.AAC.29